MAIEVERKFLILTLPVGFEKFPHALLLQGYLAIASDGAEVRIRQQGDDYVLTVKQGVGLARRENEIGITAEIFNSLWLATAGRRIEKVRYRIPAGDQTIELDHYKGVLEGLAVAEVEFAAREAAEAWAPPSWFGPEVTNMSAYKNQSLALYGRPNSIADGQEGLAYETLP